MDVFNTQARKREPVGLASCFTLSFWVPCGFHVKVFLLVIFVVNIVNSCLIVDHGDTDDRDEYGNDYSHDYGDELR